MRGPAQKASISLCLVLSVASLVSCRFSSAPTEEKNEAKTTHSLYFEEVAKAAGIHFVSRNGEEANHLAILETLGSGGAAIDYDRDGLYDLFLAGGGYFGGPDKKQIKGYPCKLFKNLGNWKFRDVTAEMGLEVAYPYAHAAAVGDVNKDGWPDLLVTGYGKVLLFRNEAGSNGARRFVDVTRETGLTGPYHWTSSAAFADFDGDGWSDLYICQYVNWSFANHPKCAGFTQAVKHDVCSPRPFAGMADFLYRNDGKGHFVDVSKAAGLHVECKDKMACGKGMGVLVLDLTGDGKPDIYVANDATPNFLYLNQSEPGQLKFQDKAQEMGAAVNDDGFTDASMGVDAADIDGSGLPSLWMTNFEDQLHALYQMQKIGDKRCFAYKTQASGLAVMGTHYVGWGTVFLDLDNDGAMDLVWANGHITLHPPQNNLYQRPMLFKNNGSGHFQNISQQGGAYFEKKHRGRGVIKADFDNNGSPDLVVSHVNAPVAVLKNIFQTKNGWLGVELAAKDRADVVGAKVTLALGKKTLTRFQKSGGSFASSGDPRILFGLGSCQSPGKLTVHWPYGEPCVEHWNNLAVGQYHRLVQGQGKR